jgi:septum formation inhibitor MinC
MQSMDITALHRLNKDLEVLFDNVVEKHRKVQEHIAKMKIEVDKSESNTIAAAEEYVKEKTDMLEGRND